MPEREVTNLPDTGASCGGAAATLAPGQAAILFSASEKIEWLGFRGTSQDRGRGAPIDIDSLLQAAQYSQLNGP